MRYYFKYLLTSFYKCAEELLFCLFVQVFCVLAKTKCAICVGILILFLLEFVLIQKSYIFFLLFN